MTKLSLSALGALALALAAPPAHADEQLLIKNPGDHPHSFFEAEPHGLIGWAGNAFGPGGVPGAGFRGTFTIVPDGFVKSINNSVGIGVGLDVFFFRSVSTVLVPVTMQWNFWLSTHWSVYGEPGIGFTSGGVTALPLFFLGGRYHFSERVALTMRIGYPAASVGVSFFL